MNFSIGDCNGFISYNQDDQSYMVQGVCNAQTLSYLAPAPLDFRLSYTGSALPFPNEYIAYNNTINQGTLNLDNGNFSFKLFAPNRYYKHTTVIDPVLDITLDDSTSIKIDLPKHHLPINRSLHSSPNGRTFHTGR